MESRDYGYGSHFFLLPIPSNHEANPDLGTELFGGSARSEGLLSSPGTVSLQL